MNRFATAKRLAALEAQAARLPEPYTGEPSAYWQALESDPETCDAREVIRAETGFDPFGASHVEYREIASASLTNATVGEALATIRRRTFALAFEHMAEGESADTGASATLVDNARIA